MYYKQGEVYVFATVWPLAVKQIKALLQLHKIDAAVQAKTWRGSSSQLTITLNEGSETKFADLCTQHWPEGTLTYQESGDPTYYIPLYYNEPKEVVYV